jgi:hypothetical protein
VHGGMWGYGGSRGHRAVTRTAWAALTGIAAIALLGCGDDTVDAGPDAGGDRDEIAFTTLRGDEVSVTAPAGEVDPARLGSYAEVVDESTRLALVAESRMAEPPPAPELESAEPRWGGEIRLADAGEHTEMPVVFWSGDEAGASISSEGAGPEELLEQLERLELEERAGSVVANLLDEDLRFGEAAQATAGLPSFEETDLILTPFDEARAEAATAGGEDPIEGAGGEVHAGDGELVLVGDSAIATMRLVMVDDETLERGRELLQGLEVDWQEADPAS